MKNLFLASLVCLVACQSKNSNTTTSPTPDSTQTTTLSNTNAPDKPQTIRAVRGFWLSDSYLLKLGQSKSPFKEKDDKTLIWGFQLDSAGLQTSPMLMGFGMHEGGMDAPLVWNESTKLFEYDAAKDNIGFFKEHPFQLKSLSDNSLALVFSKENKTETYRKVLDDHTAVNDAVVTGKYINEADKKPVEFTTQGDLLGFPKGKKRYSIQYDFYDNDQFDMMMVYDNTDGKGEVFYHYKWEGNKILFYAVTGEMPDFKIGKLAYTFVKQ